MNTSGAGAKDLLIEARSVMLDALEALEEHRDAIIVVGAQAIYLRTTTAPVALAEATKDSDLALDPAHLGDNPLLQDAMTQAGFVPHPNRQPGSWCSPNGIPVDLMVPEAVAGEYKKNRRGARIPPHGNAAARRAAGLEAALVDSPVMTVNALDPSDTRSFDVRVAGPAAMLVAKLHKIGERTNDPNPNRLQDKDAHDIFRILIDTETDVLAAAFERLRNSELSAETTETAIIFLQDLFAASPSALGSFMAGRAVTGVDDPELVAQQVTYLADDLVKALRPSEEPPGGDS